MINDSYTKDYENAQNIKDTHTNADKILEKS